MTDLLFPDESVAMDSPRVAWMKKYKVHVDIDPSAFPHVAAYVGEYSDAVLDVAENGDQSRLLQLGNDEDEAITELAKRNGWKLWNEEGGWS